MVRAYFRMRSDQVYDDVPYPQLKYYFWLFSSCLFVVFCLYMNYMFKIKAKTNVNEIDRYTVDRHITTAKARHVHFNNFLSKTNIETDELVHHTDTL